MIEPIAVVGLAGRFPDAPDVERLWVNLVEGRNSIHRLTVDDVLRAGEDPSVLRDPAYVLARPLLEDFDRFDHRVFAMTPREAALRNPQHRLFLELCQTALDDSGYEPHSYAGAIGVYAGSATDFYAIDNIRANAEVFAQVGEMQDYVANNPDYLATFVSYKLGLRGPSMTVRTACSTSLVAIHQACQALRSGECDLALAGGVEIEMPYGRGYRYVPGGIDSRDGLCRPFDVNASGTVFGSGGGVVVLKRLQDAVGDRDTVRSVVLGSAVNNDGPDRVGFTAPSVEGQARCVAEALAVSGVDPATITYVEAHGTGTLLGDPIEVAALARAFTLLARSPLPRASCAIGSIKSNLGHLGPAAGAAGFIKAVLALERRQIPATINFTALNPKLDLDTTPFAVAHTLAPWTPPNGTPLRAGVSSFGIGGTNAHIVLEEAPAGTPRGAAAPEAELVVWSAVDGNAEQALRQRLARHLTTAQATSLADLAYTLQVGRRARAVRACRLCADPAEAAAALADPAANGAWIGDGTARTVVFLFPGQAAQHPAMARGLYDRVPSFRTELDRCLAALGAILETDLQRLWLEGTDQALLAETQHAQSLLFAVEYALAAAWRAVGVTPAAMLGHSVGELVAAAVAGVFSPEEALTVVAERARLMQQRPRGAMVAVAAAEDEVAALLPEDVTISAVNGPGQVVVGGGVPAIERFTETLQARGLAHRRLQTSHAFHTPLMAEAVAPFQAAIERCTLRAPGVPIVSCATGATVTEAQARSAAFWAEQLVQPVRFGAAVHAVLQGEPKLLLEVGPGQTLSRLVARHPSMNPGAHRAVSTLASPERGKGDREAFLEAVGAVWVETGRVDWEALPRRGQPRRVPAPTYPYQRERFWIDPGPGPAPGPRKEARGGNTAATGEGWALSVPSWRDAGVIIPTRSEPGSRGLALVLQPREREAARQVVAAVQLAGYRVRPVPEGETPDFEELAGAGAPTLLLHARTFEPGAPLSPETVGTQLEKGFYSLLHLLQASAGLRRRLETPLEVVALTQDGVSVSGAERLAPDHAMLVGLIRTAAEEMPRLQPRLIDAAASPDDVLAAELRGSSGPPVVALRGAQRWLPAALPLAAVDDVPPLLRRQGVYVITGGVGGLGLEVARALAATGLCPRLCLLSRGAPAFAADPRGEATVRALESLGAQVRPLGVDVADRAAVEAAFASILAEFHQVHGIVHCAGLPGGGLIEGRSREAAEAVLRPKVVGALLLGELAATLPGLDFLVLFSSRAALNGLLGSGDYAAANAFMDALALTPRPTGARITSVNWPGWREVGMAARSEGLLSGARPSSEAPGAAAPSGGSAEPMEVRLDPSTDWVVKEHRVGGEPVVPGTAYLELILKAVRAGGVLPADQPLVLQDVVFLRPLVVRSDTRVTVSCVRDGEGVRCTVAAGPSDAPLTATVYAQARVRADPRPQPKVDLSELGAGWSEVAVPGGSAGLVQVGPRWNSITSMLRQDGQAVAFLELPDQFHADLDDHPLHPALLDVATAMLQSEDDDATHLPMLYREVTIYGELPPRVVAWLRQRQASAGTLVGNVDIYDSLGRQVVGITGFTMRAVQGDPVAPQPRRPEATPGSFPTAAPAESGPRSGITPSEGVRQLMRILSGVFPPQVAVIPAGEAGGAAPPDGESASGIVPGPSGAAPSGPPVTEPTAGGEAATLEDRIGRLWQDALGLPAIDPDQNFFQLGGDSLMAVQLMARMRERLGVEASVGDLFDFPTVRSMAREFNARARGRAGDGSVPDQAS